MRFVMPITDKRAVTDIAEYLHEKNERDYVLFISTAPKWYLMGMKAQIQKQKRITTSIRGKTVRSEKTGKQQKPDCGRNEAHGTASG